VVEYLAKGRDFGGRYIDYRTALLHSLRGTPEPLRSTVPAMLMAPPSFYVWGRRSWAGREGE
jgi:hypothetical protein